MGLRLGFIAEHPASDDATYRTPELTALQIEKMTSIFHDSKFAQWNVLSQAPRILRSRVLIQLSIEKEDRNIDGRELIHVLFFVQIEDLVDVEDDLFFVSADTAEEVLQVVRFYQAGEVAAHGVIEQLCGVYGISRHKKMAGSGHIVMHRMINDRGKGGNNRFFDAGRAPCQR